MEGHSDSTPYRGASLDESHQRNLKLSQDCSMGGSQADPDRSAGPPQGKGACWRSCPPPGAANRVLEATADKSRPVVFKIPINSFSGATLGTRSRQGASGRIAEAARELNRFVNYSTKGHRQPAWLRRDLNRKSRASKVLIINGKWLIAAV